MVFPGGKYHKLISLSYRRPKYTRAPYGTHTRMRVGVDYIQHIRTLYVYASRKSILMPILLLLRLVRAIDRIRYGLEDECDTQCNTHCSQRGNNTSHSSIYASGRRRRHAMGHVNWAIHLARMVGAFVRELADVLKLNRKDKPSLVRIFIFPVLRCR